MEKTSFTKINVYINRKPKEQESENVKNVVVKDICEFNVFAIKAHDKEWSCDEFHIFGTVVTDKKGGRWTTWDTENSSFYLKFGEDSENRVERNCILLGNFVPSQLYTNFGKFKKIFVMGIELHYKEGKGFFGDSLIRRKYWANLKKRKEDVLKKLEEIHDIMYDNLMMTLMCLKEIGVKFPSGAFRNLLCPKSYLTEDKLYDLDENYDRLHPIWNDCSEDLDNIFLYRPFKN